MNGNRRSVATIREPEFLNINSVNPLISKCEIKVLYVGQNRNRSFISKETATKMAESLCGSPIVGYYSTSKEDFTDHGDVVTISGDGIKFEDRTRPYGFVAPNSRIWFQEFEDTDEFGNSEIREYLMTEGYLWTGQYEECKRVIESGNNQSMKLNDKTLKGYWSEDTKSGIEFFIINDAIFENLCILGEDVEPCFEGANVTAPQLSTKFSCENVPATLFSMMKELKEYLKGGTEMLDNLENSVVDTETSVVESTETIVEENFSAELDKNVEVDNTENQNTIEEFKKEEDEEEKKDDEKESDFKDCEKDEDDKKKYSLLQSDYEELQAKYSALEATCEELKKFKADIEDAQKDELIKSFYMLSDEDKAEIVANKSNYSLDDIKKELSVICVDKKVSFATEEPTKVTENVVTYNLDFQPTVSDLPDWLQAVENHKKNK